MANEKMVELELRDYPIGLLGSLIGPKSKEAIDRKLDRYGYGFTSNGRGKTRVYTITSLPNAFHSFKSFCVCSLGLPNNLKYKNFCTLVFYLMNDDFNWRPAEMMEEYLRIEGRGINRATIGSYLTRLRKLGLFERLGEYVYYKVSKKYGVQTHEIISKEEYDKAWKYYFDYRKAYPEKGSDPAYKTMYNRLGGVPRKQAKVIQNAPWNDEIVNRLFELASNAILEEIEKNSD